MKKISRRNFMLATGAGIVAAPGIAGLIMGERGVEVDSVRSTSLWTTQAPSLPQQPRFEGERKVDLVIVGGGYTGLACAYYAKKFRPNWSVIVLESHTIGSGASSRNSGAVSAKYQGLAEKDMPQRGFDRLSRFIDAEKIDCNFGPTTLLEMLTSKEAAQAASVDPVHNKNWISAAALRERIGTGYYTGAIENTDSYTVHPAKLVIGHAQAALEVGVELFEHSPVLDIEHGKPAEISTPSGKIRADNVCIATNAYTPRLGMFKASMYPLHQYTLATRRLSNQEITAFGLDQWNLRFEEHTLPITFSLTPSGHFFIRIVLGYAGLDSSIWPDLAAARRLAAHLFEKRYPGISNIGLEHGWSGVTGHTLLGQQIAGPIGDGNIHVSVAYNGSGIMPSHNNGYLTACQITGHSDSDTQFLSGTSGQILVPSGFYRNLLLKPGLSLLAPA